MDSPHKKAGGVKNKGSGSPKPKKGKKSKSKSKSGSASPSPISPLRMKAVSGIQKSQLAQEAIAALKAKEEAAALKKQQEFDFKQATASLGMGLALLFSKSTMAQKQKRRDSSFVEGGVNHRVETPRDPPNLLLEMKYLESTRGRCRNYELDDNDNIPETIFNIKDSGNFRFIEGPRQVNRWIRDDEYISSFLERISFRQHYWELPTLAKSRSRDYIEPFAMFMQPKEELDTFVLRPRRVLAVSRSCEGVGFGFEGRKLHSLRQKESDVRVNEPDLLKREKERKKLLATKAREGILTRNRKQRTRSTVVAPVFRELYECFIAVLLQTKDFKNRASDGTDATQNPEGEQAQTNPATGLFATQFGRELFAPLVNSLEWLPTGTVRANSAVVEYRGRERFRRVGPEKKLGFTEYSQRAAIALENSKDQGQNRKGINLEKLKTLRVMQNMGKKKNKGKHKLKKMPTNQKKGGEDSRNDPSNNHSSLGQQTKPKEPQTGKSQPNPFASLLSGYKYQNAENADGNETSILTAPLKAGDATGLSNKLVRRSPGNDLPALNLRKQDTLTDNQYDKSSNLFTTHREEAGNANKANEVSDGLTKLSPTNSLIMDTPANRSPSKPGSGNEAPHVKFVHFSSVHHPGQSGPSADQPAKIKFSSSKHISVSQPQKPRLHNKSTEGQPFLPALKTTSKDVAGPAVAPNPVLDRDPARKKDLVLPGLGASGVIVSKPQKSSSAHKIGDRSRSLLKRRKGTYLEALTEESSTAQLTVFRGDMAVKTLRVSGQSAGKSKTRLQPIPAEREPSMKANAKPEVEEPRPPPAVFWSLKHRKPGGEQPPPTKPSRKSSKSRQRTASRSRDKPKKGLFFKKTAKLPAVRAKENSEDPLDLYLSASARRSSSHNRSTVK